MNFELSEEQVVIRDLSKQLFGDLATTEKTAAAEKAGDFDREMWQALADAGLLGISLPESAGGAGMGIVELCLVAEEQGRTVAQVPLVSTVVAAMSVAEHLTEPTLLSSIINGEATITSALAEYGANDSWSPTTTATSDGDTFRIAGAKPCVPNAVHAAAILVPALAEDGSIVVALVDTDGDGVTIESVDVTNRHPEGHLTIGTEVSADRVIRAPEALNQLIERTIVGTAAIQLGVAAGATAHAAEHVSTREQFGRALSTFQAVSQRAADGYILTEALRSTVLNASWKLDNETDTLSDTLTTAYWSSEATQKVVLGAQHLHAGLGADIDHPVHRHFLWGMHNAVSLGSTSAVLERLGRQIAEAG